MDAGQWSSPSTFYRYYKKALTSGQVQTLQQIPVFVSARRCISSSSLSQEERSRHDRTGPEREWKGPTRPRQTGKKGSRPTLQAKSTQRGVVAVDGISLRRSSQERRCSQYWPDEGLETFGDLTVKLISEKTRSHYVERRLQVSQIKKVHLIIFLTSGF